MGENFFGITDTGKQRTNNEDRFIAQTTFKTKLILACVIDGVGGYAGGEIAAQLTRDAIIDHLKKQPVNITDQMVLAFQNANERITAEKKKNPQNEQMACVATLAVADIEKNSFYFAHIGDTRLYLFRDGSLIKVTRDHSPVGFMEETGRLSEAAAMMHPKRNEVNRALGFESNVPLNNELVDTGSSPFLPGDTILICSDGLTDMVPSAQITSVLKDRLTLEEKGRQLIDIANEAGGRDNITIVLVQNNKLPAKHAITKPSVVQKHIDTDLNGTVTISESPQNDNGPHIPQEPKSNINRLLLLLSSVLFFALAWVLYKNYSDNEALPKRVAVDVPKQRNLQELNLADSINASLTGIVNLSAGQHFLITDTLWITRDSLRINGNGAVFTRDSAYTGPAFVVASTCKYLLLDSIQFENFTTGLLVQGKGLHTRNVRFTNCNVPLQFQQQLKDTLISGKQAELIFQFTDTLHK
ncbi:MAG: PP2C family serine/threonine-protein phosphatase [Ferruginibacter sp.]